MATVTEGAVLSTLELSGCNLPDEATTMAFGPSHTEIITTQLQAVLSGPEETSLASFTYTLPVSNLLFSVQAAGIFLQGQTWTQSSPLTPSTPATAPKTATNPVDSTSTLIPTSNESEDVPSAEPNLHNKRSIIISASIGAVLGAAILCWLGWLLLRRHRKKHRTESSMEEPQEYNQFGCQKPELEGSNGPRVYTIKAELDASVTRAELDAANGETGGAGLYVQKPELEGSPGVIGTSGVYVLKKSELEATNTGQKQM